VDPDLGFVAIFRAVEGVYQELARLDRASTLTSVELPEASVPLAPIFKPF